MTTSRTSPLASPLALVRVGSPVVGRRTRLGTGAALRTREAPGGGASRARCVETAPRVVAAVALVIPPPGAPESASVIWIWSRTVSRSGSRADPSWHPRISENRTRHRPHRSRVARVPSAPALDSPPGPPAAPRTDPERGRHDARIVRRGAQVDRASPRAPLVCQSPDGSRSRLDPMRVGTNDRRPRTVEARRAPIEGGANTRAGIAVVANIPASFSASEALSAREDG